MFHSRALTAAPALNAGLVFLLIGVVALAFLLLYNRHLKKTRNDKTAANHVGKRLKKLSDASAVIYTDLFLKLDGQSAHFDNILVDGSGILILRSIGVGAAVHGQPRSEYWKITSTTGVYQLKNPILEMESHLEGLRRLFAVQSIYNVPIALLVVFADNSETPELYLGKETPAIPFDALKKVLARRRLEGDPLINIQAVSAALSAAVTEDAQKGQECLKN